MRSGPWLGLLTVSNLQRASVLLQYRLLKAIYLALSPSLSLTLSFPCLRLAGAVLMTIDNHPAHVSSFDGPTKHCTLSKLLKLHPAPPHVSKERRLSLNQDCRHPPSSSQSLPGTWRALEPLSGLFLLVSCFLVLGFFGGCPRPQGCLE